jgi:hypothetical protein
MAWTLVANRRRMNRGYTVCTTLIVIMSTGGCVGLMDALSVPGAGRKIISSSSIRASEARQTRAALRAPADLSLLYPTLSLLPGGLVDVVHVVDVFLVNAKELSGNLSF